MAERTLLDTDVFSEVMRAKNAEVLARANAYVKEHGRLTISPITVMEIAKGLQKAQRDEAMNRFVSTLGGLDILRFGVDEALLAGRIYGELERLGQRGSGGNRGAIVPGAGEKWAGARATSARP